MALPFRRSRRDGEVEAGTPPPRPRVPRRAVPPPSELRAERRQLLRPREERNRDLGGVVLEMYRQDDFRESLLYDLCGEVTALEERLRELDVLLGATRPPVARCTCGAPLFWGARFCASCGRPLAETGAPAGP